jgi:hypothetical protein
MAPLLRAPLFMPNGIQGRGMLADPAYKVARRGALPYPYIVMVAKNE